MTGPTLWRVLFPITALERAGYPCGWDHAKARAAPMLATRYEAVLFSRASWPAWSRGLVAASFADARDAGRVIVYDVDDDIFSPEFGERQVALGWADGKTPEQVEAERLERAWALQQADGVTVSTDVLADVVRGLTDRPVIVVPNAIDLPWFRGVLRATTRQTQPVTIGWAGGKRPDADVEPMAAAWGRIAATFDGVRFVVQGYVPGIIRDLIPADRLVVIPWLPLEQYPAGLAEVDIACCSVADTPFNRAKSPIKAYEAAVAGSAVVATPTLYASVVDHGYSGFLAETVDQWEMALAILVHQHATRRMFARRLLRSVERRWSLAENLWRWPAAWGAIAADARGRRGKLVLA